MIPWNLLLDIALKIIGIVLDKNKEDKESKKRFLLFMESISKSQAVSVKLSDSYQKQLEELKKGDGQT